MRHSTVWRWKKKYDQKRLREEAVKAADVFFNECDKADYSYLDYMYYGHLLEELKKYDEVVGQYEKVVELDPTKDGFV